MIIESTLTKKEKNSVQKKIIHFIIKFPGVRYRELMRLTGLSNGVLTYHLNKLDHSGKVKIDRINNRVTRYYSSDISDEESKILAVLRPKSTRSVLMFISDHDQCSFNEIVDYINKVPSTVSWHLMRLKESDMIRIRRQKDYNIYELSIDKSFLLDTLQKYNNSLNSDIVEDYVEMMEEF
ncbi:MAG: winged helix-turn-helix transcriptional regulator [Nitrososphaeraceae archaeon]